MNGRNFLDSRCSCPACRRPTSAARSCSPRRRPFPGIGLSVGSQRNLSNNFIVDGLSANDDAAGLSGIPYGVDAVDQFQVVTSGGQAELGRALGGYVNVVTQERHQRRRAAISTGTSATTPSTRANALSGTTAADDAAAVRRQRRRADRARSHVLLRQRRAARCSTRPAWPRSPSQRRRPSTRGSRRSAIRAAASTTGVYPNPGRQHERPRQSRSPVQRPRSVQRALQPLRRRLEQLARRGRAERAERVGGPRQSRSDDGGQQHLDAVAADRERDARAVRVQRSARRRRPIPSVRP